MPLAATPCRHQCTSSGRFAGTSRRTMVTSRKASNDSAASTSAAVAPVPPLKNIGPEPKKFGVADGQLWSVAAATMAAAFRFGSGIFNSGYSYSLVEDDGKYTVTKVNGKKVLETSKVATFKRPAQPLQLYEFESCPFCKKVREAVAWLDLDVMVYPTPKGGVTWRPKAIELGGKKQFPFLVDPNTGKQMYESDDIVSYLFTEYGDGQVPWMLRPGTFTTVTAGLGLAFRAGRGGAYRKSKLPEKPLVFWAYDGSPFVKLAREVLCELELPYLQRTAARGSPKRQELVDRVGHFQVPYLEDPNTGVCMFESSAIIKYLNDTYAVKEGELAAGATASS